MAFYVQKKSLELGHADWGDQTKYDAGGQFRGAQFGNRNTIRSRISWVFPR